MGTDFLEHGVECCTV